MTGIAIIVLVVTIEAFVTCYKLYNSSLTTQLNAIMETILSALNGFRKAILSVFSH